MQEEVDGDGGISVVRFIVLIDKSLEYAALRSKAFWTSAR